MKKANPGRQTGQLNKYRFRIGENQATSKTREQGTERVGKGRSLGTLRSLPCHLKELTGERPRWFRHREKPGPEYILSFHYLPP